MAITIEEMAVFCKKKGIVYPDSELYGGMAGFYDYGPVGVELKNNIKQLWWKKFVQSRDDIVGIDGTIITHPKVWEASGHVGCFADVMIECLKCRKRARGDQLIEDELKISAFGLKKEDIEKIISQNKLKCPYCKGEFGSAKDFNLMFKTFIGPVESKESITYLRPETAQQMFTNFKLITETSRVQLPFGIAQIGRAFRNEISPRDFLFRTREFEMMEIEYFIHPEEKKCSLLGKNELENEFQVLTAKVQESKNPQHKIMKINEILKAKLMEEWHAYWLMQQYKWFIDLGIKKENLRIREHRKDELAHYSSACFDIEYNFPFGWKEIHGMANRASFDLEQHQKHSQKSLEIFDQKTNKKVLPRIIEPSQGVDRALLAFMFEAYHHEPKNKERGWVVLKLHPKLSPIKAGIFPLINKLDEKAREVYEMLREEFICIFDRSGAIGRRYARADELGIPFCITIDFDTLKDKSVTIRNRDSTEQKRIRIEKLKDELRNLLR